MGEKRLERDPDYASELVQRHRTVAGWYDGIHKGGRAIVHYQSILRLKPGDPEVIEWLREVEKYSGRRLI